MVWCGVISSSDVVLCFVLCCACVSFLLYCVTCALFGKAGGIDLDGDGEISFEEFRQMMEEDHTAAASGAGEFRSENLAI